MEQIELCKTPVFTVIKKSVGVDFKPVEIKCNDWVSVIICDSYGNVVLVEQTRWGIEKKTIEFPCGTVETNELPINAAIREVEEETGIKLFSIDLISIGSFNPNPAYFSNTMHVFVYPCDNIAQLNIGDQHLDKDEDCVTLVRHFDKQLYQDMKNSAISLAIWNLYNNYLGNFTYS